MCVYIRYKQERGKGRERQRQKDREKEREGEKENVCKKKKENSMKLKRAGFTWPSLHWCCTPGHRDQPSWQRDGKPPLN